MPAPATSVVSEIPRYCPPSRKTTTTATTLVSLHNLHFFADLMASIRRAIAADGLAEASARWLADLYPPDDDGDDETP